MAQRASITVNDRATTPVAHTFVPRGDLALGTALWVEPAAVSIGDRKITLSERKSGTNHKVRLKLESPVLVTETINGVNRYVRERANFADCTFTYDQMSTMQERADLVGMFANALGVTQTMLLATVVGLEKVW